MPTNLTGNPASFPTQTAPVGGDPRAASSVSTPLQNACDRTEHLKDRLDYIDPSKSGIERVRTYATAALLRASTLHLNGMYAVVGNIGLYVYNASTSLADNGMHSIKPDDVVGAGRWVNTLYSAYGQPHGIAYLTAASKVDPLQIIGGLRDKASYYAANSITTSSVTHVALTGFTASIANVNVGDVVTVEYGIGIIPASGSSVSLRLIMTDPNGTFNIWDDISILPGLGVSTENIATGVVHLPANYQGTHTVTAQWKSFSGGVATALRRTLYLSARLA